MLRKAGLRHPAGAGMQELKPRGSLARQAPRRGLDPARWMCCLAFAFTIPMQAAQAEPIVISPFFPITVTVGQAFSVDIVSTDTLFLINPSDLFAFQFDLTFKPGVLRATQVIEGPFLSSNGDATIFIPGIIDNDAGTITGPAGSLIGPVPGVVGFVGILARVLFDAIAEGVSSVTPLNVLLLNSSLSELVAIPLSQEITVVGEGVPVPEPSTFALLAIALLALVTGAFLNWRAGQTLPALRRSCGAIFPARA
jgi:hypothetical protein